MFKTRRVLTFKVLASNLNATQVTANILLRSSATQQLDARNASVKYDFCVGSDATNASDVKVEIPVRVYR